MLQAVLLALAPTWFSHHPAAWLTAHRCASGPVAPVGLSQIPPHQGPARHFRAVPGRVTGGGEVFEVHIAVMPFCVSRHHCCGLTQAN
jgi:hypothetical protein